MITQDTHLTATVVVPVYNVGQSLVRLLDALLQQTVAPDEVILVDDGSTDGSGETAQAWNREHFALKLSVIHQANQGPASARNHGAQEGAGEVVVFIDSDCIPMRDWLEKMTAPFADDAVVGVQGAYQCSQKEWIARFSQLEIEERYERMKRSDTVDFIGTYSAAYRRNIFIGMGGFDTRFPMASGEDADFSFRLASQGLRLVFEPGAVVFHAHPNTLGRYLWQKYWRAYWRNLIYRRHFAKIWRDSYTPNTLKLQTGLAVFFPVSLLTLAFPHPVSFLPAIILLMIILLTIPFTLWAARRSVSIAMGAPIVLLLRSFALGMGAAHGFVKGLWVRKEYK